MDPKPLSKERRADLERFASDPTERSGGMIDELLAAEAFWRESMVELVRHKPHVSSEEVATGYPFCRWNDEHRHADRCWAENCVWVQSRQGWIE